MAHGGRLTFIALFLAVLVTAARAQNPVSVAGEWTGKWSTNTVSGRYSLTLKQEGERVWGT